MNDKKHITFDIKNLSKSYGQVMALNDLSLSIPEGKITSIYGPNGAGKSTLVKILSGVETEFEGNVDYNSKCITFQDYSDALRNGISYLPQDYGLIPNLSGWENIAVSRNLINARFWINEGRIKKDISEKVFEDSNSVLKRKVCDLTAYEKQLVSIQKATSLNSEVFILDECTTNLNWETFLNFSKVLYDLKSQGKTIIFISHKLDEVLELADDIIVLKEGRLVSTQSKRSTSKEEIIKEFATKPQAKIKREGLQTPLKGYSVKLGKEYSVHVDFILKKGEVISIETDDTGSNQKIGYVLFDYLTKKTSINTGIIPGMRQEEAIFPNMTVEENFMVHPNSLTDSFFYHGINEKVESAAGLLDIKFQRWDQNITELSGGNQQKVVFGRWIITDFEILILIEPTAGIDLQSKEIIHNTIISLASEGKSFILISSDEGEIKTLSNRTIKLNKL